MPATPNSSAPTARAARRRLRRRSVRGRAGAGGWPGPEAAAAPAPPDAAADAGFVGARPVASVIQGPLVFPSLGSWLCASPPVKENLTVRQHAAVASVPASYKIEHRRRLCAD